VVVWYFLNGEEDGEEAIEDFWAATCFAGVILGPSELEAASVPSALSASTSGTTPTGPQPFTTGPWTRTLNTLGFGLGLLG
jgi:hypothetical protein